VCCDPVELVVTRGGLAPPVICDATVVIRFDNGRTVALRDVAVEMHMLIPAVGGD